ncbi:MAG TPA: threonine ammonia-lyase IlvA [Saprospiraceae bacterium]|nr:threonine ammonia-lyase IlvA [Saprospiraceae bacterium]
MISISQSRSAAETLSSVISPSPLIYNPRLSQKYQAHIWLKREDTLPVRSFKIRGAFNKMATMGRDQLSLGIVCASAGNHAQGVAYSCARLQVQGTIFMPSTTPQQKISRVRHFGGDWISVVLIGDRFDDAQISAIQFATERGLPFIHPFDDMDVIAGQSTVALEILDEIKEPVDYIMAPIGGGGLMAGMVSVFNKMSPHTRIVGVEAKGAPAMYESLASGFPVQLTQIDPFADGIAVRKIGGLAFNICKDYLEEVILVPEGHICSTLLELYSEEALVTEPAGAIGIAGLEYVKEKIRNKNVVVVVSGGNNDIARTEDVRERALLFEGRKHYFLIRFPQRAGALKEFLDVLGPGDDITHFQYTKKNNRDTGPALVGLELTDNQQLEILMTAMSAKGIVFQHLNHDPILFEMLV